ncbi:pentapeptide repeat-containing protein [Actinoplanes sp. NPDC049118]|uniref:pentapeptide repeat-containing protein n=1 Tax=Actinoplanes sp. NPDC049118 TaxID=3155769 RepID=UPI00340646DE
MTVAVNYQATAKAHNLTTQAQLITRYNSAVEQLGSASPASRTGAVYALGRLALDSPYDRTVIVELLNNYVLSSIGPRAIGYEACAKAHPPPVEINAALKVLLNTLQPKRMSGDKPLDLSGSCLVEVELPGADLRCVIFDNVITHGASFERANFTGANMQQAELMESSFDGANFTQADLTEAKFGVSGDIASSEMARTVFREADLTKAELVEVDLSDADFTLAVLNGTNLSKSKFAGAIMATHLDKAVNLPPNIDRSVALPAPLPPSASSPSAPECRE